MKIQIAFVINRSWEDPTTFFVILLPYHTQHKKGISPVFLDQYFGENAGTSKIPGW